MTQKSHHKIVIGDSRKMSELENESVHLIVTSPPYWQLKDYENGKQIGFDDNYEEYINNLNLVWAECNRVLKKGCRLCVNIGDQFARSVYYGRYKVIPIRTEIIKFLETVGMDYMGAIIWQKVTTCNTTGGATIMGSFPYPRNGIVKIDYEFILLFKKPGPTPKVSKKIKEQSRMSKQEWNKYFNGHWNIAGEKQDKHVAMFPQEIPKRLIKMFSFVGDTVLDPFLGSGTTTLAAKNLSRNSVGYEVSENYLDLIKEKVGINRNQKEMFDKSEFEITRQAVQADGKSLYKKLPYLFKDPVKFDKKIDPRKMHFGSRVNNNCSSRKDYHRVKSVQSPNELVLDDGLKVKLLGVKPKSRCKKKAIDFLIDKTRKQKVFMKFDDVKHSKNKKLLCYLYLQNQTFLNAHLIKSRLADADTSLNYRYKEKFINMQRND